MHRKHRHARIEIERDRTFTTRHDAQHGRACAVVGETRGLAVVERHERLEHHALGRSPRVERRDDGVVRAERRCGDARARRALRDLLRIARAERRAIDDTADRLAVRPAPCHLARGPAHRDEGGWLRRSGKRRRGRRRSGERDRIDARFAAVVRDQLELVAGHDDRGGPAERLLGGAVCEATCRGAGVGRSAVLRALAAASLAGATTGAASRSGGATLALAVTLAEGVVVAASFLSALASPPHRSHDAVAHAPARARIATIRAFFGTARYLAAFRGPS